MRLDSPRLLLRQLVRLIARNSPGQLSRKNRRLAAVSESKESPVEYYFWIRTERLSSAASKYPRKEPVASQLWFRNQVSMHAHEYRL